MKERNKVLDGGLNILDIVGKLVLIVVMAFPFFWMISTALKTLGETLLYPPSLLPESPQWSNFAEVFKTIPVGLPDRLRQRGAFAVSDYCAGGLQPLQI